MATLSPDWKKQGTVAIFDRSGGVRRPPYSALLREIWSLAAYHPAPPDLTDLPRGNGHVVLVTPAFFMGDFSTAPLRLFLTRCGYRAYGWGLGINWGPTAHLLDGLRSRLTELNALEDGPISIIGVSLGGVFARDLAYDRPDDVRQVITIVSPFRLPTASTIEPLFRLCAHFHTRRLDLARLAMPLPVPSTAIFTRDDGIVAWQSCVSDAKDSRAVEVTGQHLTVCRNPNVLRALTVELARGG